MRCSRVGPCIFDPLFWRFSVLLVAVVRVIYPRYYCINNERGTDRKQVSFGKLADAQARGFLNNNRPPRNVYRNKCLFIYERTEVAHALYRRLLLAYSPLCSISSLYFHLASRRTELKQLPSIPTIVCPANSHKSRPIQFSNPTFFCN